ncbi:TniB family NTP-binding protein [Pseudokordiimonas caeni]|uniref:TniB family NTP-binding protein n=1 Tax=Pseudokordiimonas caeni TaxID=2997908 RepID=UPI002810D189|nr:TniB family NTP-binding protein [Pseudokordiimonas caeni]
MVHLVGPEDTPNPSSEREHLISAAVRQLVDAPLKKRYDFIHKRHWYNFDYAAALIERIDTVRRYAAMSQSSIGLRVVAPSGMAKTAILEHYCDSRRPYQDRSAKVTITPVLMIELMPTRMGGGDLVGAAYEKLEAGYKRGTITQEMGRLAKILRDMGLQLLLIDEGDTLKDMREGAMVDVLSQAKWLTNRLKIPAIFSLTPPAAGFFTRDTQIDRRFMPYHIPPWSLSDAFAKAVSTVMAYMPFPDPPEDSIFEDAGLRFLLAASRQETSSMIRLIKFGATIALEAGEPRLTLEALKAASEVWGYGDPGPL